MYAKYSLKNMGIDRTLRETDPEKKRYFCSSLVAKAFKETGIFEDNDIPKERFMPGTFSMKH